VSVYHEFDPYGSPVETGGDPYGFTGEWWEDDVALLHLRARWYAPGVGVFLSRDPVEGEPPYAYVRGNPVNLTDPGGMFPRLSGNSCDKDNFCIRLLGREPVVYRKTKYDLIIFPEGHPEDISMQAGGEDKVVAFLLGATGVALDVLELGAMFSPTEPFLTSDFIAFGDLLAAGGTSISVGETYIGTPHSDFPEMNVVGQDVLVGTFDVVAGTGGKWAFRTVGFVAALSGRPETGATLAIIGQGIDAVTTSVQLGYDIGRLFFDFPTLTALGFYFTEDQGWRPVILLYCSF
jgi:RHS repeat-associated protein